jgi:para-nitrobenzyl esterase
VPVDAVIQAGIRARTKLQPTAPEQSATVPLLVGTVLNEFANSVQAGDPTLDAMPIEEVRKRLTAQRGAKADAILEHFQHKFARATPYELLSRIGGMGPRMNAVKQATLKAEQQGAPAYLYWFQWQTPILDGRPRAYHCAELPFVFANADRCAVMTGGGPDAHTLADKMSDAWLAFARKGNPNHAGLPTWPAFTASAGQTMVFDDTCSVKNDPDKEERDVLRA